MQHWSVADSQSSQYRSRELNERVDEYTFISFLEVALFVAPTTRAVRMLDLDNIATRKGSHPNMWTTKKKRNEKGRERGRDEVVRRGSMIVRKGVWWSDRVREI